MTDLAIPGELKKALAARPAAQAAFKALPADQKTQIVAWINEATATCEPGAPAWPRPG